MKKITITLIDDCDCNPLSLSVIANEFNLQFFSQGDKTYELRTVDLNENRWEQIKEQVINYVNCENAQIELVTIF